MLHYGLSKVVELHSETTKRGNWASYTNRSCTAETTLLGTYCGQGFGTN